MGDDVPFAQQVDPFNTGFVPFQPPVVEEPRWQISGDDCQVVTVLLDPEEELKTEPGSMMFMSPSVETDVECGCFDGCGRMCAGEPCVKVGLKNGGGDAAYVGLTPNFPAKVVPVELSNMKNFVAKSGAIMSSLGDVNISTSCDTNPATCCCTSLGMCRQSLDGEGTAFLAAGGTILVKELKEGETLIVDSESVVGFQDTIGFGITPNQFCTCCFGGEGMCNATMEGPGTVVVQSMSFKKYIKNVAPPPNAYKMRERMGAGYMGGTDFDFD
ncbi:hypothetical protein TrVE_jg9199 [Triparma verrucosa]|uniref:Altered inheritance of mitochondria protein 24, mitochondrial n=1 Tax=Triparma verrucosa TaxID=1606542 RepID=A0A9W7FB04_9STRA|nr:hypothetical protein TrVE_jg9199 [Triparma verrucosa]